MTRCIHLIIVTLLFRSVETNAAYDYFATVCRQAEELAKLPFQASTNMLPPALTNLTYDQTREITFQREKSLWGEERLPFRIEFSHPGGMHRDLVSLHELNGDKIFDIPFSPDYFSYGSNHIESAQVPGFSGFRIIRQEKSREIAAFQDASYFRMVGFGQTYGSSARGLALGTSHLGSEEFPMFKEFWFAKPKARDRSITIYALLDSPATAGACEFVISDGTQTVSQVTATFYPRRELDDFGVAPLVSMFWFDENSHQPGQDFRPEVHDADGLLLNTGKDEWIWRPFEAGKMARFNVYTDEHPRGFGLMQRDRKYEHYADLVAKYHERPNVWVRPLGDWGQGSVVLLQLPTRDEYQDNIVAYWRPATPPKPGVPVTFAYEMSWGTNEIIPKTLGMAHSTRVGQLENTNTPGLRFVVEFQGGPLAHLSPKDKPQPIVEAGAGTRILNQTLIPNELAHSQRLVVEVAATNTATELTAFLRYQDKPATETWKYTWQP